VERTCEFIIYTCTVTFVLLNIYSVLKSDLFNVVVIKNKIRKKE